MDQPVPDRIDGLPVIHTGRDQVTAVRAILGENLGRVLDPELAAAIDLAATRSTPLRLKADKLRSIMEQMPQVEVEIRHHFVPGVFIREAVMRKGTAITGAEHKVENLLMVSKGVIRVATADSYIDVHAGASLRCMPGSANVMHALEDAVLSNVWGNPDNETDLDVLIPRYFHAEASELIDGCNNRQRLTAGLDTQTGAIE